VACLAAAVVCAGAAGASSPALTSAASGCARQARAGYDAVQAQVKAGSYTGFAAAARALATSSATCGASLRRIAATGSAACGRTVAIRGLDYYRQGGEAIAGAALAGVRAGNSTQVALQEVLRGQALARIAGAELAVGIEVLQGRRGCSKGVALPRPLRVATQRVMPDLARQVVTKLIQVQGGVSPEDQIAFGLLLMQLDSGAPPPAGAADAQLVYLQKQHPTLEKWRLAGLRTFWSNHATGVDWTRYAFTAQGFLQAFDTYLIWKATARRQAINQFLGGIVGSEEAWRNALGSWQAWEQRWYTREQASIAEYDAWERTFKAERILVDTEALLKRGG
jgi:hypothetical protein